MNTPKELKYSRTHEWLRVMENGHVLIGITDHAQDQLGDLVYINLPEEGDSVEKDAAFGDVESVKAVSDLNSPVTGTVCAVNTELQDEPEKMNRDPYGSWIIEVEDAEIPDDLMSAEEYEQFAAEDK